MSWNKTKNIHIINSVDKLQNIYNSIESAEYISVDTETDGLSRRCQAVGVSIAWTEDDACYVPLKVYVQGRGLVCPWKAENYKYVVSTIKHWITSKKLILHNSVFDARVFANEFNIDIIPNVHCDTMLLAHTVYSEEGPLGLKPLSTILLDSDAANPQDAVKDSVKKNGGSVTKDKYEMYKCDWEILASYASYDVLYTYGLYNKLYCEIAKQGLTKLWEDEVMALLPVTYQLNNNGVRINIEYFNKLKLECQSKIEAIEDKIYNKIETKVKKYELQRIKDELTLSPRSAIGKKLVEVGLAEVVGNGRNKDLFLKEGVLLDSYLVAFYKQVKGVRRVFNFDSGDDKAFLLYDILGLPCNKFTASGKRSVDAAALEELAIEYKDTNEVIQLVLERASERKMLSTYVESILEHQQDGFIYTGFNQAGTLSGRYSSSKPLNLQTLPREDKRIKSGFIPNEGDVIIGADYESAEPKIFAFISGDQKLKDIFKDGLDFYSKVAIDTENLSGVSADPNAENFLKKVNPNKRQFAKAYALGLAYGMKAGKLAMQLGIEYLEAQDLVNAYLCAYPSLKLWMTQSEEDAKSLGYVTSIVGRKRRTPLVHELYNKYHIDNFSKKYLTMFYDRNKGKLPLLNEFKDPLAFYLNCNNELNNAKNFQIQSLAGSVTNAAMIKFVNSIKDKQVFAKLLLTVHDEIIVECKKEDATLVASILKDSMENNWVSGMIDVAMVAEPVISDISLAEAK